MKPAPIHQVQLFRAALDGVHAETLHSARRFGRHWHDSYGFGVMEAGGHRSASGRGPVEALAGQIVTSNGYRLLPEVTLPENFIPEVCKMCKCFVCLCVCVCATFLFFFFLQSHKRHQGPTFFEGG